MCSLCAEAVGARGSSSSSSSFHLPCDLWGFLLVVCFLQLFQLSLIVTVWDPIHGQYLEGQGNILYSQDEPSVSQQACVPSPLQSIWAILSLLG